MCNTCCQDTEPIHPYQPGDYAKDAVTMLALALDSQLETDNGTSSSELDDHIAATEFVGETVRLDETLTFHVYTSLYCTWYILWCRAMSNWTVMVIAWTP